MNGLAVVLWSLVASSGMVGGALASDGAEVPESYAAALRGLKARSEAKSGTAVTMRLSHLINEDKVPDVPFSLVQNVGGQWSVLVPTKGQARWYKKGDLVMGAPRSAGCGCGPTSA